MSPEAGAPGRHLAGDLAAPRKMGKGIVTGRSAWTGVR